MYKYSNLNTDDLSQSPTPFYFKNVENNSQILLNPIFIVGTHARFITHNCTTRREIYWGGECKKAIRTLNVP
jgi:hypothetical protein